MEELDLFALLYAVRKRWKLILILCVVCTLIMGIYSFFLATPMYTSQAKIFIYQEPNTEGAGSAYQNLVTSNYLISDYTELANSKPIIKQAWVSLREEGYTNVDEVASAITVSAIPDTRFIYIKAENENPKYAAAYVNAVATAFAQQAKELMKLENVNIIEEATVATVPTSPKKKRNIALGFAAGLLLGVVISIVIDLLDRKVRYPEDLKKKFPKYVLLGTIPDFENLGTQKSQKNKKPAKEDEYVGKEEEDFFLGGEVVAEAMKSIRTNILFSGLEDEHKCIAITSSVPGEGKTTNAINLAIAFAKSGYRTVLVDADLRRPKVHRRFKIKTVKGLTSALVTDGDWATMVFPDVIENLDLMPAGIRPPNPPELLGSGAMGKLVEYLKEEYEIVIIDTPPVGLFTDAALISKHCDAMLYVVSAGVPLYDEVSKGLEELEKIDSKILGFVMSRVERARNGNYYYNYKYKYNYK